MHKDLSFTCSLKGDRVSLLDNWLQLAASNEHLIEQS